MPGKIYKDQEGKSCTLEQMIAREPLWTASRFRKGEEALDLIAEIKAWDVQNFMENSKFTLPQNLRKKIHDLGA